MEYLYDYLSFLARAATIVVAVVVVISSIVAVGLRRQQHAPGGCGEPPCLRRP